MLERLNDLPHGLDGLNAIGRVSREDYERVFEPAIESARGESFEPRTDDGVMVGGTGTRRHFVLSRFERPR
jgi:hypothetical protein